MDESTFPFRVGIVGIGQLGASLAARLMELQAPEVNLLTRDEKKIPILFQSKLGHRISTSPEILKSCDITIICVPPSYVITTAEQILPYLKSGSILSDVTSIKQTIVQQLEPKAQSHNIIFLGSHPMAGSERSGWEAKDVTLYQNRVCFLTPTSTTPLYAIQTLRLFWKQIGCQVFEIDPDQHDFLCAKISHALHAVAASIVLASLADPDRDNAIIAAAGAFRDMTRIASSNPEMWTSICLLNDSATIEALNQIIHQIEKFKIAIQQKNTQELYYLYQQAKELHTYYRQHSPLFQSQEIGGYHDESKRNSE